MTNQQKTEGKILLRIAHNLRRFQWQEEKYTTFIQGFVLGIISTILLLILVIGSI